MSGVSDDAIFESRSFLVAKSRREHWMFERFSHTWYSTRSFLCRWPWQSMKVIQLVGTHHFFFRATVFLLSRWLVVVDPQKEVEQWKQGLLSMAEKKQREITNAEPSPPATIDLGEANFPLTPYGIGNDEDDIASSWADELRTSTSPSLKLCAWVHLFYPFLINLIPACILCHCETCLLYTIYLIKNHLVES